MAVSAALGRRVSLLDPEIELELLDLLGQGSYGAVRKARRRDTGKTLAVKIIPIEACSSAVDDLKKEIDMMSLLRSPYVVALHACYLRGNDAWIAMEYCGGGSVDDIMEACKKTLSEEEIICCVTRMALGLQHLHQQNMVHRDVKAGNVLLTTDGKAKLADFGVSAVMQEGQKRGTVIGTPYWMAPEIIQELPYDIKCDIWSLGITAIEMAEGSPPLSKVHPMRAIFMIPSKPPPKLKEESKWTLDFIEFVAACLAKDPESRPTAQDLLWHPWLRAKADKIRRSGGDKGCQELQRLVTRHLGDLHRFRMVQTRKANSEQRELERPGNGEGGAGGASEQPMEQQDGVGLAAISPANSPSGRCRVSQCDTLKASRELVGSSEKETWLKDSGTVAQGDEGGLAGLEGGVDKGRGGWLEPPHNGVFAHEQSWSQDSACASSTGSAIRRGTTGREEGAWGREGTSGALRCVSSSGSMTSSSTGSVIITQPANAQAVTPQVEEGPGGRGDGAGTGAKGQVISRWPAKDSSRGPVSYMSTPSELQFPIRPALSAMLATHVDAGKGVVEGWSNTAHHEPTGTNRAQGSAEARAVAGARPQSTRSNWRQSANLARAALYFGGSLCGDVGARAAEAGYPTPNSSRRKMFPALGSKEATPQSSTPSSPVPGGRTRLGGSPDKVVSTTLRVSAEDLASMAHDQLTPTGILRIPAGAAATGALASRGGQNKCKDAGPVPVVSGGAMSGAEAEGDMAPPMRHHRTPAGEVHADRGFEQGEVGGQGLSLEDEMTAIDKDFIDGFNRLHEERNRKRREVEARHGVLPGGGGARALGMNTSAAKGQASSSQAHEVQFGLLSRALLMEAEGLNTTQAFGVMGLDMDEER